MKLLEQLKKFDSRLTAKLATNSIETLKSERKPEEVLDAKIESATKSLKVYEKEVKRNRAVLSPNSIRIRIAELEQKLIEQEKERIDLEKEVFVLNRKVTDTEKELEVKKKLIEDEAYLKKQAAICRLKNIEDVKAEEYKQKIREMINPSKQKEYKKRELSQNIAKVKLSIDSLKLTAQQYKVPEEPIDKTLRSQIETANKALYTLRKEYKKEKAKYEEVVKESKKKLQVLSKVVF